MLLTGRANPLTGAPGAIVLYALLGLIVWPNNRPGGLLGPGGARVSWGVLWLAMAGLWLLPANSGGDATRSAIEAAPAGTAWLAALHRAAAAAAAGHGTAIALTLALASTANGVAAAIDRRRSAFLALGAALNLAYWVLGQGFGGVLTRLFDGSERGTAVHPARARDPPPASPGPRRYMNPLRAGARLTDSRTTER
jgi:hypothetical protein